MQRNWYRARGGLSIAGAPGVSLRGGQRHPPLNEVLPMLKRPVQISLLACAPALAALVLAGSAAADRAYYTWQTEEGAVAFTDDAKAIPEAYRKQAQRRTLRSLESYERLTPNDARATSDYAARL